MKGTHMMKEGPSAGIVHANQPNNSNTVAVKNIDYSNYKVNTILNKTTTKY